MQNSVSEFTTHLIAKTATATRNGVEFLLAARFKVQGKLYETDFLDCQKIAMKLFSQCGGTAQVTVRHYRKENHSWKKKIDTSQTPPPKKLRNAHLRTDWCAWPALISIVVAAQLHYAVYCHTASAARQTTAAWMEPFELPYLLMAGAVGNQHWDEACVFRGSLDVTWSSRTWDINFHSSNYCPLPVKEGSLACR